MTHDPRPTRGQGRHASVLSRVAVSLLLVSVVLEGGCDALTGSGGTERVSVMTQNVYLGADIFKVTQAQDPSQVPLLVAQAWATVQATNFPARAGRLAAQIAAAGPDLVGLQEVSLYRLQSPGDLANGGLVSATDTVLDYLKLLQDSLAARGAQYQVVIESKNADVEMPMATTTGCCDDIRMTDRDVILARSGVKTSDPKTGVYTDVYTVDLGGLSIPFRRSWESAQVDIGGKKFRFVNTHLETEDSPTIQEAQATELVGMLQGESLPVLLVGDFNSAADGSNTTSHSQVLQAGYTDTWDAVGSGDGLTCCHLEDLMDASTDFYERIDYIFFSNNDFTGNSIQVVGDQPADRTAGGLWPSDHAGVTAALEIK